ncbi:hypothetical protein V8C34DRAFT_264527 [Trichoderma compactum]
MIRCAGQERACRDTRSFKYRSCRLVGRRDNRQTDAVFFFFFSSCFLFLVSERKGNHSNASEGNKREKPAEEWLRAKKLRKNDAGCQVSLVAVTRRPGVTASTRYDMTVLYTCDSSLSLSTNLSLSLIFGRQLLNVQFDLGMGTLVLFPSSKIHLPSVSVHHASRENANEPPMSVWVLCFVGGLKFFQPLGAVQVGIPRVPDGGRECETLVDLT